ncbi:MAG TPA: 4-hydroxyproline epimerase [Planctomycetota bacterium]|nr:4-hydroxyproline epimerase [Planctomycetota bacterium]
MIPIEVVDSHTGGEPTRVVVSGGPDLGRGALAERVERFRKEHDRFRSAVVNEPRGSESMVGALLCDPVGPGAAAGVIFFNNVGVLGMCGHGTIGLIATLAHLGRIQPGAHRIETPVGVVTATLHPGGEVSVANVPSYRTRKGVGVDVDGIGRVVGDVAWGGNWFFLVEGHGHRLDIGNVEVLTDYAWRLRRALWTAGVTGDGGAEIDHIELLGPTPTASSRNFVLCPGKAYDRSPCGTGTCAKLACLVADGKLKEGEVWRQESIVGSVFEGSVKVVQGVVHPTIKGSAYITARSTLLRDPRDPFASGIRH